MQVITLTAPDGHRERWDIETTYLALKFWYKYLSDPDQLTCNKLAEAISPFVGDDVHQVHIFLIYVRAIKQGLFRELTKLTDNQDDNVTRLYFTMKAAAGDYSLRKSHRGKRGKTLKRIQEVTNGDPAKLNQLIELLGLFVDGYLSYEGKGALA